MTGTTIAQIIALAIYPILTKIYSDTDFGLFTLYMSIISITGIMSTGRYQLAILMPEDDKKAINLAALGVFIGFFLSVILLLLVVFFRENIGILFKNEAIVKWAWYIPLSTFLIAIFQVSIYWFNRHKNFKQTAVANLSQSVTNSGLKLSTSSVVHGGGGLIAGAIGGQIIGAVWFIVKWIRTYREHFRNISYTAMMKVGKEYYRFPGFNLPNNLINNISNSLPVFLLSTFFTSSHVGLYGMGFAMIFRPMNLITNSMEQVFSQRIINKYNDKLPLWNDIRLLLLRSAQISIIPFLLAGIFGPFIFKVIFGPGWEESGRYMQLLVPWLFAAFMANQLTFLPDMFSRQKTAFLFNAIRLVLRIGGMAVGIYFESVYLMLALFSLASLLVVIATIVWYIVLVKSYEKERPADSL